MTRRTWLILSAVVLLSLVGVGMYLATPPKPGVTRANFLRLHQGMSEEQVEEILGRKADDVMVVTGGCDASWSGPEGDIEIGFSYGACDGNFRDGSCRERLAPRPHGFLVTARSWLERNGFLAPDPKALPDITDVIRAADRKAELDQQELPPLDPAPR
jgi:hypothetical protein